MYGTDSSQATGLAATGLGWTAATLGYVVAAAVLLVAGATLLTIARVVRHKVKAGGR